MKQDICILLEAKKGSLYLYDAEPRKNDLWDGATRLIAFNKLFQFIKWEDTEPRAIKDILDNCIIK